MKIAIQGIVGSFHNQAASKFAAAKKLEFNYQDLVECDTFREVFDTVKSGTADYGVVAVENSLHGSINSVYRLLASERLWICGEVRLPIQLYLIASKKYAQSDFVKIEKIISQAEALSQCEQWLNNNDDLGFASIEETNDTAASVRFIMKNPDLPIAAVAGKQAAEIYEAEVIAGPINDDPDNYTRFFVLCKKPRPNSEASRTSIIITEDSSDKPGTLVDALTLFKEQGINLSKLDSHPLPGESRRYSFYIDFDASLKEPSSQAVVNELAKTGWTVQVLGSY